MYEVKLAETYSEKKAIADYSLNLISPYCIDMFGVWSRGCLVGGFAMSNINYGEVIFTISAKNSVCICKALQVIFAYIFKKYKQINSSVPDSNYKSIKITKQLGAKTVYKKDNMHYFILDKAMWAYQERYPI